MSGVDEEVGKGVWVKAIGLEILAPYLEYSKWGA